MKRKPIRTSSPEWPVNAGPNAKHPRGNARDKDRTHAMNLPRTADMTRLPITIPPQKPRHVQPTETTRERACIFSLECPTHR